jgi:hypothetical protein
VKRSQPDNVTADQATSVGHVDKKVKAEGADVTASSVDSEISTLKATIARLEKIVDSIGLDIDSRPNAMTATVINKQRGHTSYLTFADMGAPFDPTIPTL